MVLMSVCAWLVMRVRANCFLMRRYAEVKKPGVNNNALRFCCCDELIGQGESCIHVSFWNMNLDPGFYVYMRGNTWKYTVTRNSVAKMTQKPVLIPVFSLCYVSMLVKSGMRFHKCALQ